MSKIGFFGGSFNPVTNAHINLALDIIDRFNLDKIIFVPVGNTYNKEGLIDEIHRYNMLSIATKDYQKLEVSDMELNIDKKLETIDVFNMIKDIYINDEIYYILGADNLYKMLLWKEFEKLVEKYKYIIIKRDVLDCDKLIKSNETLTNHKENFNIVENINYSKTNATYVREKIQNGNINNIIDYIPISIMDYIKENKLYR